MSAKTAELRLSIRKANGQMKDAYNPGCASIIQLNPALTDFRGLTVFACYWRTSVIVNKENKRN